MNWKRKVVLLSAVLLVANVYFALLSHGDPVPLRQKLETFPSMIGDWQGLPPSSLAPSEARALSADEYLWRVYRRGGQQVALFIAYYRSQKSGDTMHSPKNCYPGGGWEPMTVETIQVPGRDPAIGTFPANHIVFMKDGSTQQVIYWYQSNHRVFASEYKGKFYLVYDALTKHRTDGAIVRLGAPDPDRSGATVQAMVEFARELSLVLPQYLPE